MKQGGEQKNFTRKKWSRKHGSASDVLWLITPGQLFRNFLPDFIRKNRVDYRFLYLSAIIISTQCLFTITTILYTLTLCKEIFISAFTKKVCMDKQAKTSTNERENEWRTKYLVPIANFVYLCRALYLSVL